MTERRDTDYYFFCTVNVNMDYFTRAEIEVSYRSRDLKHLIVWPSNKQLIKALSKNFIIKFPVLSDDVRRAHVIYGPDTAILKGGMARNNPKNIEFKPCTPIQEEILKHHPELPLHMDFCFINRYPYFATITKKVNYRTIR